MSWILYHVDRIGRIAHDSGVIVRVHRLGVGHQRCFNQMPCTAAINPAYPPNSGSISHAPNTSYSAKALMSPFYHVVFYTAAPSRTHVIAWMCAILLLLDISDPEKWFTQMSLSWRDIDNKGTNCVNIIPGLL